MRWTVKNKLIGIGGLSVVSLVMLAAIAVTTSLRINSATDASIERHAQIGIVENMRRTNLELVLAAMDSIVDKDEGKVGGERTEVINSSIAALTENQVKLAEIADNAEEQKLAQTVATQIQELSQGIKVDLVRLIENRADAEAFAAIDDIIDKSGIGMDEVLAKYEKSVKTEVEEAMADVHSSVNISLVGTSGVFVVSLVVLLGALFFIARSIVVPIGGMTAAMLRLADGDKEAEVPATDRDDEVGEMAGAVQVFKENMIKNDEMVEAQRQEQEARQQRAATIETRTTEFDNVISTVIKSVAATATEMESTAESMSATAAETNVQATAVAAASEEASTNVQTVAAAAEELSSSISEISRQVAQSSEIAGKAVKDAEHTNDKVQGLAEAANKIGEVVALITDIADQTNLLALNATIEAARAGDAGKGFAVVASEVKNLANQTAKATEEIGSQIGDIQTATQEAVGAIEGISKTITEIDEIAAAIAAAVEEQGAATQEIARNVEQAAAGTTEVSSNIAGVTQAAGETGQASGQVREAAGELSRQAEALGHEIETFITDIKAA